MTRAMQPWKCRSRHSAHPKLLGQLPYKIPFHKSPTWRTFCTTVLTLSKPGIQNGHLLSKPVLCHVIQKKSEAQKTVPPNLVPVYFLWEDFEDCLKDTSDKVISGLVLLIFLTSHSYITYKVIVTSAEHAQSLSWARTRLSQPCAGSVCAVEFKRKNK